MVHAMHLQRFFVHSAFARLLLANRTLLFLVVLVLGAGADGIELVPLLNQLLGGRVRQLEGLARQRTVQPKRTQNHYGGRERRQDRKQV